jgi:CHAT domain-containing protein
VTTVKNEPLANYRVVYFATHALVAGEVEKFATVKAEPALVLSIPDKPSEEDDGLLTASEVAMLKLNADFVVLSACTRCGGAFRSGACVLLRRSEIPCRFALGSR